MARKKKTLVTPVIPQKTEVQSAQVTPQSSQKDISFNTQVSSEAKPTPTTLKP
ncbi:MAG: hypothetical protein NTX01_03805 [Candidatus Omnitrophica bacterium]|nr:hypothetical protein [Candidatus Omnitrophota bacterium]